MNIPRAALALDCLPEELILEAENYIPEKKSHMLRYLSIAACLCLIIGAVMLTSERTDNRLPAVSDDNLPNESTSVVTEELIISGNAYDKPADDMEVFGSSFIEMYFKSIDLKEPYNFGEFTDIPLFEKYMSCVVEQRLYAKQLFDTDYVREDYSIKISLANEEKLEGCYRLHYAVITDYIMHSGLRNRSGDGIYLLITDNGGEYQVAGMQHANDPYFNGDKWGNSFGERCYIIDDPDYWRNADEQEMLDKLESCKKQMEAMAEEIERQQEEYEIKAAKLPVPISEGIPDENVLQLIEKYYRYLSYIEDNRPVELDLSDKYEQDGKTYYRVTDESIDTWEEWSDLVLDIFSSSTAWKYLHNEQIIGVDGKTYRLYTDGSNTEELETYLVSYNIIDGHNAELVTYQKLEINGKVKYRTYTYMLYQDDDKVCKIASVRQNISL